MVATFRPTDPLLGSQWHLSMIGRLGFGSSASTAGLERIWADYTGAGVNVGIWDDGVQRTHWDLDGNYDASLQVTISGTLNDGQPLTGNDGHGTSVAGLIAAESNGLGGVGVAFDADVTAIRIFGGADDINNNWPRYLQTLDYLGTFDVTNHSYGAYPDFQVYGDTAKFQAAAEAGRGGLGTINVKSAGNSNVDGNGEELDSSRFTVTVAALGTNGNVASYSTYGSHVLVSAPAGSVTTDLLGNGPGYDGLLNGDYTDDFGGTSAAGPITVGVVTLMLDANPLLGWRDVQNILSYSAVGTGSLYTGVSTNENFSWKWNGADNWNGGGLHYGEDYGYGMVSAYNAVRMAEVWSILHPAAATSANEATATTGTISVNRPISDLSTLSYSFNVTQNISLEHVALTVTLSHSWFTDLRIRLVSPDGTVMSLYDGSTGDSSTSDSGFTYTFGVDGLRGELSQGTWTLQVQDAFASDTGTLQSVAFTGYGSFVTNDDVYHYTDEVLTVLAQSGQSGRMTLSDSDGGSDWINAAAMYRDLVLNLNAGTTSTLAGTGFLAIAAGTLIENAIAGDGNDQITGNHLANILYGMRGDDTLDGGPGNDTLDGGQGSDTAVFSGQRGEYGIQFQNGVTTVTRTADGITDVLTNFEFLQFADQTIADPSAPVDATAPALSGTSPADDATGVAIGSNIVLTFSEAVKAGSGAIVIHKADGTVQTFAVGDPQVVFSGDTVTIDAAVDLAFGTSYYVTIDVGAITDLAGNPFAGITGSTAFNFETQFQFNTITGTSSAETLNGTAGVDHIYGLGGNDTLNGNGDNDLLDGGTGADRMAGGAGNDTYVVDNTSDKVTESTSAGTDTVRTSLSSHTLASNVENLVYTGTSAFSGTGNSLNNTITGGIGNDTLRGNSGSDTLSGGDGADVLRGGTGKDFLFGCGGADRFDFDTTSEAGIGSTCDVIEDFAMGDRIDLSTIDANTSISGNQAFSGTLVSAFTGVKGQLRVVDAGDHLIVSGDRNGDRIADFDIQVVTTLDTLSSSDFIL